MISAFNRHRPNYLLFYPKVSLFFRSEFGSKLTDLDQQWNTVLAGTRQRKTVVNSALEKCSAYKRHDCSLSSLTSSVDVMVGGFDGEVTCASLIVPTISQLQVCQTNCCTSLSRVFFAPIFAIYPIFQYVRSPAMPICDVSCNFHKCIFDNFTRIRAKRALWNDFGLSGPQQALLCSLWNAFRPPLYCNRAHPRGANTSGSKPCVRCSAYTPLTIGGNVKWSCTWTSSRTWNHVTSASTRHRCSMLAIACWR